ncbi:Disease resistance protein [Corchorus capsularis]|uniref:Disease resistance protein n=1 Tax=Corchorus capsularis TaxID=210143 RepID=A0A1R3GC16_COCAP|nr:Disease resistance protein [Corchorus capsularis]
MADALLSAVVNTILDNINSLWLQEFGITGGLKTELESLQSTLTTIQAVLLDAEEKQWTSEAIKNWLRKLKDAAYDVDDRESKSQSCLVDGTNLEFLNLFEEEDEQYEDKEKIVNVLFNTRLRDENDLSIYAICGMGGLGKTTLIQLVYNDERVERAFDLRIWVCVSDSFEVIRLTRAIIESIDVSSCEIKELDPLQRHLQERLMRKRFLLILDDVWSESSAKWESLRNPLMSGANGSTVIVTTRIEKVAHIMATPILPIYHLGYLPEHDSWLLFKQRAFQRESEGNNMKLERIGKQIVKKCGGVPLAVKALGSMLRLKRKESEWLSVKESEIWELSDDGSSILPALRLSYDNLPPYLRQCFAYCCIFPKDTKMDKSWLIELWIANGFVPPRGQRELCEIGDEIFNELSWRSFFQDVKEHHDGTITCKMHDLIHDLAISIMRFECYMFDIIKCVDISHCHSLKQTPPEISCLAHLLELSIFIVRKDRGCGIGELKELNLGNELCIKELVNVEGSTEAKSANLMRKLNLKSLSLIWGKNAGEFPDNEEEVLSSLQPHSNLLYLQICGYQGLVLAAWMIEGYRVSRH